MQQTQSDVAFEGTDEERHLAEQIFSLARFQGRFFATTAPIRLRRDELVEFIARQEKRRDHATLTKTIDAALRKNPGVFVRSEADDGAVTYVTTRGGVAPVEELPDTAHTLVKRFLDPSEIAPAPPPKPTQRIADAWAQRPAEDGLLEELGTADLAAAQAAPEPEVAEPVAEVVAEAEPAGPGPAAPAREPERPAARPAAATLATVPAEQLRAALAARLEADDRFASFGDQYYPEDLVDRYSRGDLRRIREFIQEEGEPLADETLLQTLFGRRPNDPAYQAARFSINYRLSREKRDFEFVGTRDSRLWTTPTLPPIGTPLRKASELGQDYRYLLDEPEAPGAAGPVTHTLTFF